MTGAWDLRRFETVEEMAREAACIVVCAGQEAVASRGRFTLALSGGSTPRRLYRLLAEDPDLRAAMPWPAVHVFWGDERHVPPTAADSNFRMAWDALLRHVPVDTGHIHRVLAEDPDAASAAEAYERTLRHTFATPEGRVPAFDLVLLGMGADGHTASLFPGSSALEEQTRLVLAPWVEQLGAWRITVTPPVLVHARAIVVQVSGADKAAALADALEGPFNPARLPAQCLRRATGEVTWLVDARAAGKLGRGNR